MNLFIDGNLKASGAGSNVSYSWNTRKEEKGSHTVQVVARDAAGNISSRSVQVSR